MKKIGRLVFDLGFHLFALGGLTWFFLPYLERGLAVLKLPGHDSDQFIFFADNFSRRFVWPPAGWDNLWYEGAPRILNMTFLHFYLIQPLIKFFGLNLATKIYPLIWLAIFLLLAYFVFYLLAKNHGLAFALTLVLLKTKSIFLPIYINGVVLAGLAEMVLPAIFFFLILYALKKDFRYFVLAAICLALQFYSHGAIGLFFGSVTAFFFLIFYRFEKEKWLSWLPIKRLMIFSLITLAVGALAILPQLLSASGGGYYSKGAFMGGREPLPEVFQFLGENTHPALFVAFGMALLVGIIFHRQLKLKGLILPLLLMLIYFLVFLGAMIFGLNPLSDYLFPARIIWYFAFVLAALAALLFSGLSGLKKPVGRCLGSLGQWLMAVVIMVIVFQNPINLEELIRGEVNYLPTKEEQDQWLRNYYREGFKGLWSQVDQQDKNQRAWLQSSHKIYWNIVSEVPLLQGYFHFYTQYSPDWTDWLFAAMAEKAAQMQTLPEEVAEKQAQFLIDWYGIKYLMTYPDPEFNVASRYWRDNQYTLAKSVAQPPAVLTMRSELTSGIVEAVNVPVIGFVGKQSGYNAFLRDLALLNLNTHYLVPLRLSNSIEKVPAGILGKIDLLVVNNFEGKNWDKIYDFVKKGGKVWIETGGESSFKEKGPLHPIFPSRELAYGSLGEKWQVKAAGELSQFDFSQLEPLVYRGDPWKLYYVLSGRIEEGEVLLSQAGKPIITEQLIGQGKVIWSGANLWYRPMEFLKQNSLKEVELLRILLSRLIALSYQEPIAVDLNRPIPEKIMVAGQGFKGIILKENSLPGWQAKAEGRQLSLYSAGPDLMYFALPDDLKGKPVQVKIGYRGPWVDWLLFFLSLFSLFFALEEVITQGWLKRKILTSSLGKHLDSEKWGQSIGGWWEKEEE